MSVCRKVVGSGRGGRVLWDALWVGREPCVWGRRTGSVKSALQCSHVRPAVRALFWF